MNDDTADGLAVPPDIEPVIHLDTTLGPGVEREYRGIHIGDDPDDLDTGVLLDLLAKRGGYLVHRVDETLSGRRSTLRGGFGDVR